MNKATKGGCAFNLMLFMVLILVTIIQSCIKEDRKQAASFPVEFSEQD